MSQEDDDSIHQHQDCYEYLNWIMQNVPLNDRHTHYKRFLDKVLGLAEEAEKDAVLTKGREVFKYRMDTVRADLKRQDSQAGLTVNAYVPSFALKEGTVIGELVYNKELSPPIQFAVYHDGTVEYAETVTVDGVRYSPPDLDAISVGSILLPSKAEEYDDEEQLFLEIRHFINTNVQLENPVFRNLMVYYAMVTWMHDCFDSVPYIRATGDYGSGKSRFLQTLGVISYRGMFANGAISEASLFRIIDSYRGTLVLDEMDFTQSDTSAAIIKMLNVGYQKGSPVLRVEKVVDKFKVVPFYTYGPKVLVTRTKFRDQALESRCLAVVMTHTALDEKVKLEMDDESKAEAQTLRNKLLMWRFRNYGTMKVDPHHRIPGLSPRMIQVVRPILQCVKDDKMKEELLTLFRDQDRKQELERQDTIEGIIAIAIARAWNHQKSEAISIKSILEQVKIDHPERRLNGQKVSDTVRRVFGFKTMNRGGYGYVLMDNDTMDKIYTRYTIEQVVPRRQA